MNATAGAPIGHNSPTSGNANPWRAGLALAALGVVYGDIGTSPLYALKECFNPEHGVPLTQASVLGILSLVFWALMLVVTIKYVLFVLRADHDGEGGIMALQALARHAVGGARAHPALLLLITVLGLTGTAMFYGDSVITPAISVLSAVEGLEVATPVFKPYVIPLTLVILIGLFAVQRFGTGLVGKVFGPVMVLWFGLLALLGVQQIARHPEVLMAINPAYALAFLSEHRTHALAVLGSVFLAVTGGEALYADMGHFGAKAIRLAWFFVALPGLVLNYFGQGALVLAEPAAIDNPFFRMVPAWGVVPMVVLAAAATVIASQAVISGAFSLTAQAMRMGYLPRLRIVQTSGDAMGQIYLPAINWILMGAVLLLVLGFKSSSALSSAYGIAVSVTMVTTTLLAAIVARRLWRWNLGLIVLGVGALLMVDATFFVANSLKIADGGWLPLLIAVLVLGVFTTWAKGRRLNREAAAADQMELEPFLEALSYSPPHRVHGTAVFLTSQTGAVPHALLHNLKHNQVLHETVVLLAVQSCDTPRVEPGERIEAHDLGHGFWRVTARHGFMERPDVPEFMKLLSYQKAVSAESMSTSYFTSRESLGTMRVRGLNRLQEIVFGWLHRNAGRASDYFELPGNRVVEMGRRTG